jgi:hypothetical protein
MFCAQFPTGGTGLSRSESIRRSALASQGKVRLLRCRVR